MREKGIGYFAYREGKYYLTLRSEKKYYLTSCSKTIYKEILGRYVRQKLSDPVMVHQGVSLGNLKNFGPCLTCAKIFQLNRKFWVGLNFSHLYLH